MNKEQLHILWTNADTITSEHMVMMYSENAIKHGWWKNITVIIWGATSQLVAENEKIQDLIVQGEKAGVKFSGCIACATQLGTVDKLTDLGIELIGWGEPLTTLIKDKEHVITV